MTVCMCDGMLEVTKVHSLQQQMFGSCVEALHFLQRKWQFFKILYFMIVLKCFRDISELLLSDFYTT